MKPGLPFAHLNLRANPFGEQDRDAWAATAVVRVAGLVEALREPGVAVQLVAPCGRGKTTHLLALAQAMPEASYVRADTDGLPHRIPDRLLLDEADALPFWRRWRALRAARSVAVAVHADHARELSWLGFRVVTHRPGGVDPQRLAAIVNARIEAVRRGSGPVPRVSDAGLQALVVRYGDDLRAVRRHLYERFQHLTEIADVEV